MKILDVITNGLGREGITTTQLDFFRMMDKEGMQVDVASVGRHNEDVIREFNGIGCNVIEFPSRKKSFPCYVLKLWQVLREGHYDAVYVHGSSAILAVELVSASFFGCRIRVAHSHNTTCIQRRMDRLLRPVFYRSYTRALACGEAAGRWLYENRDFMVIKNGRDIDVYQYDMEKRKKIRARLNLPDGVYAIGNVGNFNRQKNQKFLIEIFAEVRKLDQNVRLFLMGDGELRESVEELVRKMGLSDGIVFTGSISNVPEMLQAMDMMVLPSLHEGLPLVAIEWQIAALPCVISDTVTRECAFTDLAHFVPLSAGTAKWANEILKYRDFDRESVAEDCARRARENGYDIRESARKLREVFMEKDIYDRNKKMGAL